MSSDTAAIERFKSVAEMRAHYDAIKNKLWRKFPEAPKIKLVTEPLLGKKAVIVKPVFKKKWIDDTGERCNDPVQLNASVPLLHDIRNNIAKQFGVSVASLRNPYGSFTQSRVRMMAMAACRTLTNVGSSRISRFLEVDHATVLHACNKLYPVTHFVRDHASSTVRDKLQLFCDVCKLAELAKNGPIWQQAVEKYQALHP